MAKYLLYPGCSMESSAKAYRDSLQAVAPILDMGLEEIVWKNSYPFILGIAISLIIKSGTIFDFESKFNAS